MRSQATKRILAMAGLILGLTWGATHAADGAADAGDTKKIELPGVTSAAESAVDKVYITSQPTQETFDALAQKGVKMVINMRRADEMAKLSFDEKTAAKNAGMDYINVQMNTGLPKQAEVDQILAALAKSKEAPVLLHCSSGNRASAIWALYSGARKGPFAGRGHRRGQSRRYDERSARTHRAQPDHRVAEEIVASFVRGNCRSSPPCCSMQGACCMDTAPGNIKDQEPKAGLEARNILVGAGCILVLIFGVVSGCIALTQVYDQDEGEKIEQPGPDQSRSSGPSQ